MLEAMVLMALKLQFVEDALRGLPSTAAVQRSTAEADYEWYTDRNLLVPQHVNKRCWAWFYLRQAQDTARTARERYSSLCDLAQWIGWENLLRGQLP